MHLSQPLEGGHSVTCQVPLCVWVGGGVGHRKYALTKYLGDG